MKKLFALLLAGLMIISLGACSSEPAAKVEFQGEKLVDTEDCSFYVASIKADNFMGFVMNVEMKNNTDTGLMFGISNASVNGCMCDPYWSESVSAGDTVSSQVTFAAADLEAYGITEITEIEFTLSVIDEDTYEETFLEDTFTIYPLGEDAVQYQQREAQKTDIVLMDNEYCSVIVTGKDPASFWGYDLYVYLINKTDKTLMFSTDDVTINGTACDPYWAATVAPGKCSSTAMYWFDTTLEDSQITDVQTITMTLSVSDFDNWLEDALVNETVTLEP